jgi:hypothetical protein
MLRSPEIRSRKVGQNRYQKGDNKTKNKQTNSVVSVLERTIPTERPCLSTKLVPTFVDRGCRVVSATDPYGRSLNFLGRTEMAMRKRIRICRILAMVYNTQDYWVSGLVHRPEF